MKRNSQSERQAPEYRCEAEVTEGLESVSEDELCEHSASILYSQRGEVGFHWTSDLHPLLALGTVQAVYSVEQFDVPRPRALLSNVHLPRLLAQIDAVRRLHPQDAFQSFYLAAAGSDSSVMQRIKAELSQRTGLAIGGEKGDLWLRVRPGKSGGWETLVRLSPRPLVTRAWRVCNLEGALNAAAARALIRLTQPQPDDCFVNLGCGSGTLLIERVAAAPCQIAFGIDTDAANLRCARANIAASRYSDRIDIQQGDMTRLPLESASVDALCADLPFGQLTGTHADNLRLYPQMLREAARVARAGARFVAITHEVRLMDKLLREQELWRLEREIRVNLRGLHPRVYILIRR